MKYIFVHARCGDDWHHYTIPTEELPDVILHVLDADQVTVCETAEQEDRFQQMRKNTFPWDNHDGGGNYG